MRWPTRLVAVAFAGVAAAGCAAGGAATTVEGPTTTSFVAAASPERLSAACPFLDSGEVQHELADGNSFESTEEEPETQRGVTLYACSYHRALDSHASLVELGVGDAPGFDSPEAAFQGSARGCADEPKPFTDDAVYCTTPLGSTTVTIAKRSHGRIRIAQLAFRRAPSDAFLDAYAALAKTVAGRL
ncbi:hypothetical protein [Amycolatopsis sp. NPDC051372]|uniref:hypothetical protein n=1 Tax=Amycolatopsis sp. NPDC051372 TaxID=3155669 RepID=UPI00343E98CE